MRSVTTHEAKTHLSKLLAEVEKGGRIIIRRGSRDVAMLVPLDQPIQSRLRVGTHTSDPVWVEDGAFDPLSDADLAEWGL